MMTAMYYIVALLLFPYLAGAESSVSRTIGVAPLSVHFSAGTIDSSPNSMPFHDYEYSWDFGDPDSGAWGTTGKSKNTDKGPVAAHVYEKPGIYKATLTVRNSNGAVDTDSFTITVSTPDTTFSGTKTTCVSTGTDFADCPPEASHVTTNDLTSLSNYTDAGERVLLRRGDYWSVGSYIPFPNNSGPVHIGAFGTCLNPDLLGICENAPNITITGSSQFFNPSWKKDWRLTDISFTAAKGVSSIVNGSTKIQDNLFMRVKSSGFANPILFGSYRQSDADYHDNNALVSSRLSDSSEAVVYMGSERMSITGNIVQNTDNSHTCRIWHGYQGVISHNIMSGSNGLKHTLKLHGPAPSPATPSEYPATCLMGTFAETGSGGLRNYSKFIVIANNVFGAGGSWLVSIGPQDQYKDERLSDVIFEKNRIISDYGNNGSTLSQNALMVEGRYVSVRNNVIDGAGSSNGFTGIQIWKRGIELAPVWNKVYNNTIHNAGELSSFIGVSIGAEATDTDVKNNLVSFGPVVVSMLPVNDFATNSILTNNISSSSPYFVDSSNTSPLLRNYRLTAMSYESIAHGTSVDVFYDFDDAARHQTYDVGAFVFRNRRLPIKIQAGTP